MKQYHPLAHAVNRKHEVTGFCLKEVIPGTREYRQSKLTYVPMSVFKELVANKQVQCFELDSKGDLSLEYTDEEMKTLFRPTKGIAAVKTLSEYYRNDITVNSSTIENMHLGEVSVSVICDMRYPVLGDLLAVSLFGLEDILTAYCSNLPMLPFRIGSKKDGYSGRFIVTNHDKLSDALYQMKLDKVRFSVNCDTYLDADNVIYSLIDSKSSYDALAKNNLAKSIEMFATVK